MVKASKNAFMLPKICFQFQYIFTYNNFSNPFIQNALCFLKTTWGESGHKKWKLKARIKNVLGKCRWRIFKQ